MPTRDRLLAAFVALLWGLNFLAIHATLDHFPPLFAGALRFVVLAIPTILFVPRPNVKLRWLIGYGMGFGTLQFAFLFVGMAAGMPTGLASLVLQASAPFTVVLGAILLREKLTRWQVGGIVLAVAGMCAIAWHRSENAALLPVILTLLGALGWAGGNLCARQAKPDNPMHLTMWMTVVPPIPMFALSLAFEGPARDWESLATAGSAWESLAGLGYTAVLATVLGSGIWTTLMRRNPASSVAPFSLLVPVIGMSMSFLLLHERPAPVEIAASVVVVCGVLLGTVRRRRPPTPELELPRSLAA